MNKVGFIIMWVAIIAIIVVGAIFLVKAGNKPGEYDTFATCIEESGTKFYGAWWCPHCQNQKTLFGKSAEKLPYVECSTTDGKDTTQVCKDAGIKSYPTWVFPDGSKGNGEQTLEQLAQKSGCELKEDAEEAAA